MNNSVEKTYIEKGQTFKLDSFLESACEKFHLYNYMGAISMALQNIVDICKENFFLKLSSCKNGISISITTQDDCFSKISFSDNKSKDFEKLFLIKNLSDEINISNDGKTIDIIFYIDGIEEELYIDRKQKINSFSKRKTEAIK